MREKGEGQRMGGEGRNKGGGGGSVREGGSAEGRRSGGRPVSLDDFIFSWDV